MIDVDQSGTIEVAEFIGPLSRWAHDSKTAPRFIKYNMLQTMHLQEDLYALSEGYFAHLATKVDDLANQVSVLTKSGLHGVRDGRFDGRNTSKLRAPAMSPVMSPSNSNTHESPDGILSSSLGLWTRHTTEEVPTINEEVSPQESVEVDQPQTRQTSAVGEFLAPKTHEGSTDLDLSLLESLLESAMLKLEAKLDVLDRKIRGPEVGLGSDGPDGWKGGHHGPRLRKKTAMQMLHPEAFRRLGHGSDDFRRFQNSAAHSMLSCT